MIQTIFQRKAHCMAATILLLISAPGCGTGEYEQRLTGTEGQIKQGSVFAQMRPSAPLAGTSVKIQVPSSFVSQPFNEQTQVDGAPIDPRRLKPPSEISFTGLQHTYEEFLDDAAGGKMAYYCYLAAVDKASVTNEPIMVMRRQAQSLFSGSTGRVEDVQCETPQGQSTAWKKLRATGPQAFYYVDQAGKADFREMDGALEVYSRTEGNTIVMIAWRVPTNIEGAQYVDLQTWAPRVAGAMTAQ